MTSTARETATTSSSFGGNVIHLTLGGRDETDRSLEHLRKRLQAMNRGAKQHQRHPNTTGLTVKVTTADGFENYRRKFGFDFFLQSMSELPRLQHFSLVVSTAASTNDDDQAQFNIKTKSLKIFLKNTPTLESLDIIAGKNSGGTLTGKMTRLQQQFAQHPALTRVILKNLRSSKSSGGGGGENKNKLDEYCIWRLLAGMAQSRTLNAVEWSGCSCHCKEFGLYRSAPHNNIHLGLESDSSDEEGQQGQQPKIIFCEPCALSVTSIQDLVASPTSCLERLVITDCEYLISHPTALLPFVREALKNNKTIKDLTLLPPSCGRISKTDTGINQHQSTILQAWGDALTENNTLERLTLGGSDSSVDLRPIAVALKHANRSLLRFSLLNMTSVDEECNLPDGWNGNSIPSAKLIPTNQAVLDAFATALEHNMVFEHLGGASLPNDVRVTPSTLSLSGWSREIDFYLEANANLRPLLGFYDYHSQQDDDEKRNQPQISHGTQWIRTIFQHRYDLPMIHYLLLHNSSLFESYAKGGASDSRNNSISPAKKRRKMQPSQAWWKM